MPGYRGEFINEAMTKPKSEVPEAEQKLISEAIAINNFNKVCRAIGAVQIIGTDCTDDTSTTILCKLTTPADQLEVGDIVIIGEGGANKRQWYVEIAVDDKLQFDDNDLIVGSAEIQNYNAIRTDLMLWIIAKSKIPKIITASEILLTLGTKGLNDSAIPSATTIAGEDKTIKEVLEWLSVNFPVLISTYQNQIRNGDFIDWNEAENLPDHWDRIGKESTITIEPITEDCYPDNYSINKACQIINLPGADPDGLKQILTHLKPNTTYYLGFRSYRNSLKQSCRVYTEGAETNIDINFADNEWELKLGYFVTDNIGSDVTIFIWADVDGVIGKIDSIMICEGMPKEFTPHISDIIERCGFGIGDATKDGIQKSSYVAQDSTGSNNAYLLAIDPAISAYAKYQRFIFKANFGNTTACTLNINSKGAIAIKKWSAGSLVDLASGDIPNGSIAEVIYDGTYFVLLTIGKNEHTRAHDVNSAPDHNASGSGDKGKVARANPSTGVIEFGSPDKACCVIYTLDDTTAVEIKEGVAYIVIPEKLNGFNLIRANAIVLTAGTANATTFGVRNVTDSHEMLSANISIASEQKVGTVGTINTSYDDVATNDVIAIDCDAVSTTAPLGLLIVLEFQLP